MAGIDSFEYLVRTKLNGRLVQTVFKLRVTWYSTYHMTYDHQLLSFVAADCFQQKSGYFSLHVFCSVTR